MRVVPLLLLAMFCVGALAPPPVAAAPPGQQLPISGVPIPKPPPIPTGYDLAVSNIGTTGPMGSPANCPLLTFKNVGSKPVNGHYTWVYKRNGAQISSSGVLLILAPGQSMTKACNAADGGFAFYGDTVEATIDSDDELSEDNEVNNTLTKKLLLLKKGTIPLQRKQ